MALSEHKKKPDSIVRKRDGFWPDLLPLALERLVIAYYLTPLFEDFDTLDEKFDDDTMKPFRAAKAKITLFLETRPLLKQIYQRPTQPHSFMRDSVDIFDQAIKHIAHFPLDGQLDFLLTVYEEDWDRAQTDQFKETKETLQRIFRTAAAFKLPYLKLYVGQVILDKLNDFISSTITSSYQTFQAGEEKTSKTIQQSNPRELVAPLLRLLHHEHEIANARTQVMSNAVKHMSYFLVVSFSVTIAGYAPRGSLIERILITIFIALVLKMAVETCRVSQRARDRFFQPVSESKPDNDRAAPLTTEQQTNHAPVYR